MPVANQPTHTMCIINYSLLLHIASNQFNFYNKLEYVGVTFSEYSSDV